MVVAPNPIDFSVLADFSDSLADSPYVLALHCVLFVATVLVALWLRRLDKEDIDLVRGNDFDLLIVWYISFVTMSVK